ncbi:CBS domain-containing protein [Streptomyces sp. NBC_00842]|uniref:CBS domain-containing protein n=1 Tax=unclassified Streptomyces TaxID=2593676 RepID=UPI003865ED91
MVARDLTHPAPELTKYATGTDAIDLLRRRRASLALVCDDSGRLAGTVSLGDLLARFLQPQAA